jgi:hypothetical protein
MKTWAVFMAVAIGFFAMITLSQPRAPSSTTAAPQPQEPCDVQAMVEIIEQMKRLDTIYRTEFSGGGADIYVGKTWYELPIDGKGMLDLAIHCRVTGLKGGRVDVYYYDFQSGKQVARSSATGLRLD